MAVRKRARSVTTAAMLERRKKEAKRREADIAAAAASPGRVRRAVELTQASTSSELTAMHICTAGDVGGGPSLTSREGLDILRAAVDYMRAWPRVENSEGEAKRSLWLPPQALAMQLEFRGSLGERLNAFHARCNTSHSLFGMAEAKPEALIGHRLSVLRRRPEPIILWLGRVRATEGDGEYVVDVDAECAFEVCALAFLSLLSSSLHSPPSSPLLSLHPPLLSSLSTLLSSPLLSLHPPLLSSPLPSLLSPLVDAKCCAVLSAPRRAQWTRSSYLEHV